MNPLLEQLHDVEELDFISRWPLPLGWWIVITVAAFFLLLFLAIAVSQILYRLSWKGDSLKKLKELERHLSEETARETVITLSEYLRRIALKRFSRKECASLTGNAWLMWLTIHDPKKFNWTEKGVFLIDGPYSPTSIRLPMDQIRDLIQAAKNWVR